MRLIDAEEAERLYAAMGPAVEVSGGSAANTLAGMAALGERCAFIGQVADDQLGHVFTHDLRALGVAYETPALQERSEERRGGKECVSAGSSGGSPCDSKKHNTELMKKDYET